MAKEDIWGDNDDVLGGKKGSKDINTLRKRAGRISKNKGFAGMLSLKKKKGHHVIPKTGFADMIGKKSKVYKAHGFI